MIRTALVIALLISIAFAAVPASNATADNPISSYCLSPKLLKNGLRLNAKVGLICTDIDFRPTFNIHFGPTLGSGFDPVSLFGALVLKGGGSKSNAFYELERSRAEADIRLKEEQNNIEREKLKILIKQLDIQVEQAKTARAYLDHAKGVFEYQQKRDESYLRRLKYSVRPDKLVVVVADFSDGGTGEGVQVADELAIALTELRVLCGIDFEILVGEIKPGVVIRSEHMARDIGQHFPNGSCYAVVWGTLSPRTVGKFRPHVTCVMKNSDEQGVSNTYTIDLNAQELPFEKGEELTRRARHEELVAFTCAFIPGCYAAYELSCERVPDLSRLIKFLGESPEVDRLVKEMNPLRKWPEARKHGFEYLSRMTRVGTVEIGMNGKQVTAEIEYPQAVVNRHDGSVMTLITEDGDYKPRIFDDPVKKQKYIAYIDTTETTWGQFIPFYNQSKAKNEAGNQLWLKFDKDFTNVKLGIDGKPPEGKLEVLVPEDQRRPVFNITYHGALEYCRSMGKDLPRKVEWQAAARGKGTKYPWGDKFDKPALLCANKLSIREGSFKIHPVGRFVSTDLSGIGCVDMAGNVAEWCEEFDDFAMQRRVVCGGSFNDESETAFDITKHRNEAPDNAQPWIGFRGVVRIPINTTNP
jgi:hypothetical protein